MHTASGSMDLVETTSPGLGRRSLRTLRTGSLVGLAVGVVLVVDALVADDTDVTFTAYAITLGIGAVAGGIGAILWAAAAVFSRISAGYVKQDAPLSNQPLRFERACLGLGLGAAGAVACLLVAILALLQGESLF